MPRATQLRRGSGGSWAKVSGLSKLVCFSQLCAVLKKAEKLFVFRKLEIIRRGHYEN